MTSTQHSPLTIVGHFQFRVSGPVARFFAIVGLCALSLTTGSGSNADQPSKPVSAETTAAYDQHLAKANALFKEDKLEAALAETKSATTLDASRYEAYATAALILHASGKPTEAAAAVKEAAKRAPADKQAKVEAVAKVIGVTVTPTAAPKADKAEAMSGATRRQLNALMLIIEEAQQAPEQPSREKLLLEFLEKSGEFVKENPSHLKVWSLRAAAALELDQPKVGWEAGQQLVRLGADDSKDTATQEVMAKLERKGWLGKTPPAEPKLPVATRETPFENSLGMKFVPVPGTEVLFSVWETRKGDYAAYAHANSGVDTSWQNPVFKSIPITPADNYPVVNVSWNDARAFCEWLTKKEQREGKLPRSALYRLPTDAEWSHAVGIGSQENGNSPKDKHDKLKGIYPWGAQWPPPRGAGNYFDRTAWIQLRGFEDGNKERYVDGFATAAPVGSFNPNGLGLYDLGGNAHEWCVDKWHPDFAERVMRGGAWGHYASIKSILHSSFRFCDLPGSRMSISEDSGDHIGRYGFRAVLAGASVR